MGTSSRPSVALLVVGAGLAALAGCGADDDDATDDARAALVVEAIVRDYAAEIEVEPDAVPVVFVAEAGEAELGIGVQAATVEAVHDDVDVRFVDDRAEAIDGDADGAPLRVPGVLLGLGEIDDAAAMVDVDVERYVDESDRSDDVVVVEVGDGTASVMSRSSASSAGG
jgi:hypothetical protein